MFIDNESSSTMLLRPQMVSRDRLHKKHYRFWISQSYNRSSNWIKWASFTQAQTYKFASEHPSFDSIRTSNGKIRYTKSFIYFMQFILCHLFGLLLHAVLVNSYLLY